LFVTVDDCRGRCIVSGFVEVDQTVCVSIERGAFASYLGLEVQWELLVFVHVLSSTFFIEHGRQRIIIDNVNFERHLFPKLLL
jgi:hypothetical protein